MPAGAYFDPEHVSSGDFDPADVNAFRQPNTVAIVAVDDASDTRAYISTNVCAQIGTDNFGPHPFVTNDDARKLAADHVTKHIADDVRSNETPNDNSFSGHHSGPHDPVANAIANQ